MGGGAGSTLDVHSGAVGVTVTHLGFQGTENSRMPVYVPGQAAPRQHKSPHPQGRLGECGTLTFCCCWDRCSFGHEPTELKVSASVLESRPDPEWKEAPLAKTVLPAACSTVPSCPWPDILYWLEPPP